jgi:hypothetical protein
VGSVRRPVHLLAAFGVALALLVGVVATVEVGWAGSGAASGPVAGAARGVAAEPSPGAPDGVRALLARRADAIRRRDQTAFAATLDPAAAPDFRASQLAMFANLADVPLAHWEYLLDPARAVPVPIDAADPGADELWAPATELRYALAGADGDPTSRPLGYLYARRGESWYLGSDTALDTIGTASWRGPWDFGPCRVTRVNSGLVISHPGAERLAHQLADELDGAVAAVTAVWGAGWPRRVAVIVPSTPEELTALVGARYTNDSIAAMSIADHVDRATDRAYGQRVVLNVTAGAQLGPTALRVVLRHELTHVAARAATDEHTPLWLQEGLAEYVGYRDSGLPPDAIAPGLASEVRAGRLPTGPPPDAAFAGPNLVLAYQQAWSLVHYLASRLGADGAVALYQRLAADPAAASQPRLDDTLRATLGTDLAGLLAGWRADLLNSP